MAAGLKFRPVSNTIQDVLTWRGTNFWNKKLKAGIDSDKERELFGKWHEAHSI